jgi:hypothetical protein
MSITGAGESAPRATGTLTIPPWEAVMVDLADTAPLFANLEDGFLGSMALSSNVPIGAQSYVNIVTSARAVSGFEGVPFDEASDELFAPLFRSRQRSVDPTNRLDTGISVVNPGPTDAEVTVTYFPTSDRSASDACRRSGPIEHGPVEIPAGSSHVFYQGPRGGHGIPEDCFGSAVIQTSRSNERVLAMVNDSENLTALSAAYQAVPRARAHTKIAVPLFRSRHLAQEFTTGIQVMNVTGATAEVHIDFFEIQGNTSTPIQGCGAACDATIEPFSSHTWWPPNIAAIPPRTFGSAVIHSDQPIAVIVNDYPIAGGVDFATYNGVPVLDVR